MIFIFSEKTLHTSKKNVKIEVQTFAEIYSVRPKTPFFQFSDKISLQFS